MPTGRRSSVQPSGLQSVVARVSIDFLATTWQGFSSGSATGQSACRRIRTLTIYLLQVAAEEEEGARRDSIRLTREQPPPGGIRCPEVINRSGLAELSVFISRFVSIYLVRGGLRAFVLEQADRGLGSCLFSGRHDFT